MEAEVGGIWPQALDTSSHWKLEEAGKDCALSLWTGCGPADTLTSDSTLQSHEKINLLF